MRSLPLLEVRSHGNLTREAVQGIRDTLQECYLRLGNWLPDRVEVHIFETSAQQAAFLDIEKAELGIDTSGDEAFICTHDAWRGYPRLLISMEKLSTLSTIAQLGTLRHEAAHTVLHGGLAYYVFRLPPDCLELAGAKGLDQHLLQQLLYYCAIAVKDFEASRLLVYKGYWDCQLAFVHAQFVPSFEDELAWLLAKRHPRVRVLFLAAQLKPLLLGWPLKQAGLVQVETLADSMLSYLEPGERKRLIALAAGIIELLGNDTHENVSAALRQVLREL